MTLSRTVMCVCVAIAACILFTPGDSLAQGSFIRGDANCDGVVNGSDTTKIIFHLFMSSTIYCMDAGDVDDDGDVDLSDLLVLANYLHGIGPAPLAPFPDCGSDPTADALSCDSSACTPTWTCPITVTGDCNMDGVVTAADVIVEVNYVFKSGADPLPCIAAADVDCNASVTAADIIAAVNFVFKGGDPPCDVCTLMPGTWGCP